MKKVCLSLALMLVHFLGACSGGGGTAAAVTSSNTNTSISTSSASNAPPSSSNSPSVTTTIFTSTYTSVSANPSSTTYGWTYGSATTSVSTSTATWSSTSITPAAPSAFQLRGFNFDAQWFATQYWSDSNNIQWIDQLLQFIKAEGANMFVLDWMVQFNADGTIVSGGGIGQPPWSWIVSTVQKAKNQGFYVVLKPHISTAQLANVGLVNTDVATFLPSNFFPAWTQYLNNMVSQVAPFSVDAIAIGTENNVIDTLYRDKWQALISSVRSNYSGALTYDSVFKQWVDKDIKDVVFWDLLDYISCSLYVFLSPNENSSVATLEGLMTSNPAINTPAFIHTNVITDSITKCNAPKENRSRRTERCYEEGYL